MNYNTRDLIDYAYNDEGTEFRAALYSAIHDKVINHIESMKKGVAQGIITQEEVIDERRMKAKNKSDIQPQGNPVKEDYEELDEISDKTKLSAIGKLETKKRHETGLAAASKYKDPTSGSEPLYRKGAEETGKRIERIVGKLSTTPKTKWSPEAQFPKSKIPPEVLANIKKRGEK